MAEERYSVAVRRDFVARHYLVGGDWGRENEPHSHHYRIELELVGDRLDRHNYLLDIVAIEAAMDAFVERYRDRTLNDLEPFASENPSIELFCRIAWDELTEQIDRSSVASATVTVWENEIARASYTRAVE